MLNVSKKEWVSFQTCDISIVGNVKNASSGRPDTNTLKSKAGCTESVLKNEYRGHGVQSRESHNSRILKKDGQWSKIQSSRQAALSQIGKCTHEHERVVGTARVLGNLEMRMKSIGRCRSRRT